MDVLTDRTIKSSDYYSRYNGLSYYYNHSRVTKYVVQEKDTYDLIALKYYNNPTYYWIICDYNRVRDPFIEPTPGTTLELPSLNAGLEFEKY